MTPNPVPFLAALMALSAMPATAQDAGQGARLYLGLPGGQASCVECHGPDPGLDRNRLLNAARGPFAIDEALRKAAAMGYLAELLSTSDKADLAAFLALVSAEAEGGSAALAWPWGLEFGRTGPGAALAPQPVRLLNRGTAALAVSPRLRETLPGGAAGLTLAHDCPPVLPPGAGCTVQLGLVAAGEGRVQAALDWGDGGAALRPLGVAATVTQDAAVGVARWLDADAGRAVALQAAPGGEATAVLDLHNTGAAALVLGVPAITGPGRAAFRLATASNAEDCAVNTVLPPGGRCRVRVVATAAASGLQEASLQWRNDGTHAPIRRLQVQAVGAAPPTSAPPAVPGPTPSPAPSPTPAPVPAPVAEAGGGAGGCSRIAWAGGRADPLLPGLLLAAVAALAWRRCRPPGGAGRQPALPG